MTAKLSFKCPSCEQTHEGSPSFAFRAPDAYLLQPKEVQEAGHLGQDLCHYEDEDGAHYFIRVCLEIPIHGIDDPFTWGVWASVSKASFDRYVEIYNAPNVEDAYPGEFCNSLPCYTNTLGLKALVRPRTGGIRPFFELQQSDHPLALDFLNGLSVVRTEEIAVAVMHH